VVTFRDAEVDQASHLRQVLLDFSRERLAEPLSLPRLDHDETGRLLSALLAPGQVSPPIVDSVFRETEGNPFFVEEVCKGLLEEERLYRSQGAWFRRDLTHTAMAASGHAAILSRVDRLPPPCLDTLRLAAVIGRSFDFEVLKAAGTQDEDTLIEALERAEQAQLIAEERQAGQLRFQFAHALIPFALTEAMGHPRRQRLHQRVALALERLRPEEDEALAHHFAAAGERSKASDYSRRAGERAAALYDYRTALKHYQAALGWVKPDLPEPERVALLERIADLQGHCGEQVEAIGSYQAALAVWRQAPSADRWTGVRLQRKAVEALYQANTWTHVGPLAAGVRAGLEDALRLASGQPPHREAVRLHVVRATDAYWQGMLSGDRSPVEPCARAAIEIAEQLDDPVTMSAALGALDRDFSTRGLYRERLAVAQRRLALSRDARFGDRRERINVTCQASLALMLVGEYEQGLVLALEAEGFAVEVRDVSKQVYAMQLQAQCFFGLDRWDEMLAVEDRRRALEAEYGSDRVDRMCYYCGIRANVLGWRGEFELAEAQRQESLDMMTGFFGGPPATWPPVGHY
jgi:tetratricopeptide (TPR) repeat protein